MNWRGFYCLIILLIFLTLADAHVPIIVEGNKDLENAIYIEDPLKSWAVYDRLPGGGIIHYYRFNMMQGQSLHLSLFVPGKGIFVPGLIIIGPGITSNGSFPFHLEIPDGSGALLLESKIPRNATYEPFTPNAQYDLSEITMNIEVDGTYYAAVYSPSEGGNYGLAIGSREEFDLVEWITVPFSVIRIHLWEGQSPGFIFAPMAGIMIMGFLFLYRKHAKGPPGLYNWISSIAGLLYTGSGAIILVQMLTALSRAPLTSSIMITLILTIFPIVTGFAILHISLQDTLGKKTGAFMIALGITGLFIWAGLIIGPVMAILSGLLILIKKTPSGRNL